MRGSPPWTEAELGNRNESRILVQGLAGESPKEVIRVGDARKYLASACWAPDSRSLVLHIIEGSRRPNNARFEIVDLSGRKLSSLSAAGVPAADKRAIVYMIDCR